MTKTVQQIDREVAEKIVVDALAADYHVSVFDGEEWAVRRSITKDEILGAMFATGMDVLRFGDREKIIQGSVTLIYGNTGWDVIADYTDNAGIEALLKGAQALAAQYEDIR